MINEKKIRQVTRLVIGLGMIFCLLIGYGIGSIKHQEHRGKAKKESSLFQTNTSEPLTQDMVEDFLMAYFTKKDLGENRNRYKPFMTEGLYQETVNSEEEPTSKTYQGFVVDFVYQKATIYIDEEHKTAIVTVTYTTTLLAEKGNYKEAQKNVSQTANFRLVYTATQTGKLLLNRLEPLVMADHNGSLDSIVSIE